MLQALIGAGLSGAGSLLGGLGAKSAAKDQQLRQEAYDKQARERVTTATDIYRERVPKWLVSDAAKAGFNPVTWLQNGALGWYGTQLSGLVSSYGNATQAINIPSSMSAWGGAISSFAGALSQGMQFDQKMQLEYDTLDQQGAIAAMRYGNGGYGGAASPNAGVSLMGGTSGPLYSAGTSGVVGGGIRDTGGMLSAGGLDWINNFGPAINKKPRSQDAPVKMFGWLDPHPSFPSTQLMEDQYGDVAGSVYGFGKAAADLGWTVGRTDAGMRFKKQAGDLTEYFQTKRPSDFLQDKVVPFFRQHNQGVKGFADGYL